MPPFWEGATIMWDNNKRKPRLFTEESFGPEIMSLAEMEKVLIEDALILYEGNITKAAEILKIGRNTLYRKIREYQIDLK